MFAKILQWIKEILSKMINTSSVKDALKVDVAISPLMTNALQLWSSMYINQAPWLGKDVKSLNLPAAIASEISRAVTIEMDVEISGSLRADYLYEQIDRVYPKLRQMVEVGIAKGGLMLKSYILGKSIVVDFVQADQFYPISFDANGQITACVFSDQRIIGASYYTRLEYHQMTPEGCVIRNMAYKSESQNVLGRQIDLAAVPAWADLEPESLITGVTQPLFAYFRYPLANNIDPTSPLGVSCYARAVDLIRDADVQWSNLLWEFESGGRALYVDTLAFGKDDDGKPLLPNKRLYRTLNQGGQVSDEEMFHEWSPTLREQNILAGLDAILKKIEFNCGLAYGTLSDPNTVDKTATEIISSKQRSAATVTDCQKALENALEDLLYAMDVWATLGNLAPKGKYEAAWEFDDSIVTDHVTQFVQDTQMVGLGAMSKVELRMRTFGETEEIAREKMALVQEEGAGAMDFFGLPTGQQQGQNMPINQVS
jgi:A118 family predicted phage portal protein